MGFSTREASTAFGATRGDGPRVAQCRSRKWRLDNRGEEFSVFELDGIRFGTPICFEDTFGYISREFVRRGADVIVNLTNDLWSKSVAASMQHMQMAVFRATETARSMVRSTTGGMTAIIDPNGRITEIYPPFVEGYLIGDVPIYTERRTLFREWGDWFAWVMLGVAVLGLFAALRRTAL